MTDELGVLRERLSRDELLRLHDDAIEALEVDDDDDDCHPW